MISNALAAEGGNAVAHAEAFYEAPEFWVAISFMVFVALMARPAWRMATKALDDKIAAIAAQLDEAARLREEAQDLVASYKRKIAEAEKEAENIVNEARDEAQRLRTKMAEDLETSLQRREKLAMDRIAQAEQEATDEVRAIAADVALEATRTVLTETVTGDKADQLIDKSIEDLPRKLN